MRVLLRREGSSLSGGIDRLIDIILAPNPNSQLLALVNSEKGKVQAKKADRVRARGEEDKRLDDEEVLLTAIARELN